MMGVNLFNEVTTRETFRTGAQGVVTPSVSSMNGLNPPQSHPIPQQIQDNISVPDQLVGLIIGKNGEQINRIQQETGCRVQIVPNSTGGSERPCTLTGTFHQVHHAKQKLNEIITRGGPRENGMSYGENKHQGQMQHEMQIPPDKCGLIIGKGGNTLKQLMQEFNVKLHLVQESAEITRDEKPLKIIGTPQAVESAKNAIVGLMAQKDGAKPAASIINTKTVGHSIEVSVPKAAVGVVIGRGGENISKIQNETNTRIQFKTDDPTQDVRSCSISGTPEACQIANDRISEIARQKLQEQHPPLHGSNDSSFMQGQHCVEYPVPASRAGVVIGKGGENIRLIKENSGAFVQIEKNASDKGENWKTFIIRGTEQQIQEAQKLIQDKAGIGPPNTHTQASHSMDHFQIHGNSHTGPGTPTHQIPQTPNQGMITQLTNQVNSLNLHPNPGTPGPPPPSNQPGIGGPWPQVDQHPDSVNQGWNQYPMYGGQPANGWQPWNTGNNPHQQPRSQQQQNLSSQWAQYYEHAKIQDHHAHSYQQPHMIHQQSSQPNISSADPGQWSDPYRGHLGTGYHPGQGYPGNTNQPNFHYQ